MSTPQKHDRAAIIDRGFAVLQRWSIRLISIAAALYILGWVVGQTWVVWFPIALAMLFATVLAPPAKWLRDRGMPAAAAAGIMMLAFLGGLGGLFSVVIPQMVDEAPQIAERAASGIAEVQNWLVTGPFQIEPGQITDMLNALERWLKNSAVDISTGVLTTLGTAAGVVFNMVIILMLTFLFLKDGHKLLPFLHRTTGNRVGGHLIPALTRTWLTLGGFIRTQGLVSFIDAVLIGIGLSIMDVPLALPLATLTFIGGFIPIIGAFVTGALAVLVTLVTNSPRDALIVLIIIVAVQQLEGNILSPILQGKSMNLHPAVVLLGVTAGGSMFGITGAFLAVPLIASISELLRYIDEEITASTAERSEAIAGEPFAEPKPPEPPASPVES